MWPAGHVEGVGQPASTHVAAMHNLLHDIESHRNGRKPFMGYGPLSCSKADPLVAENGCGLFGATRLLAPGGPLRAVTEHLEMFLHSTNSSMSSPVTGRGSLRLRVCESKRTRRQTCIVSSLYQTLELRAFMALPRFSRSARRRVASIGCASLCTSSAPLIPRLKQKRSAHVP